MILKLLIIKVFLLFYVTSAKLKLIHNVKDLVNHNDTENPFNNTFDYNDLITLNETMEGKDEIEKLSSATATTSSVIVPTTTTEQPFKYATTYNQISLKDDKDEDEEDNEQQQQQHLKYHYKRHYTTFKFNNNNNLNSNRLKTFSAKDVAATETTTNNTQTLETIMIPITTTTFNENKNLKDLENTDDNVENDDDDDDDDDDDVDNIEENDDNLQQKHQTKLYASSNSYYGNAFVGQLPQFQLQQQQLQLYQQQQGQQLQQQQPLLPQEYHHLSDYRLLFNPERHTEFYLHTLTTTPPPATPPATPSRTSSAATPSPPIPPQDDGYDTTRREGTIVVDDDRDDAHDIVHDDVAAADDDDDNDTLMMTTTNVTNPRVLTNVVTDTIGAAFGVNTRPVAAIHGIRIEAIELYNGLSLRQSRFNPFNPCRILIHGWLGGLKAGIYNTLVPEYLKLQQGRYNVFTVDWGKGAIADYITASYRVKPVGKIVAKFIDFLHQESGVPFEHIQVIGFSMGAHIAGIAGKYIQTGRLPVIYALDPALPLFRYENINERLDRSDADYVEVVHTSAGSYGYDHPLGHVDFYINFGYNQPGCFFNECSHLRAYQIFAHALQKEVLVGRECSVELWLDMLKHKRCISETGSALAINAEGLSRNMRALRRGVYYVITNSQPPFKII